jgi:glycosyltransferase involved in cell wall biosynthesis
MPVLHIVVPVYNERDTLEPCLRRVVAVDLPMGWTSRLYLVDDHSEIDAYESAAAVVERLRTDGATIDLFRHQRNRGKGAALQTGFDAILGGGAADDDLVTIQDADLEYDPGDFPDLMSPLTGGDAGAVVGTRWGEHTPLRSLKRKIHAAGNRTLTLMSNLMTGYRVSDMECCYKMMSIGVLRQLRPMLSEERFGIEPQMIAGLARLGETVVEVPVRYEPRGLDAGKKIGWVDGVRALYVIARERLRGRPRHSSGAAAGEAERS